MRPFRSSILFFVMLVPGCTTMDESPAQVVAVVDADAAWAVEEAVAGEGVSLAVEKSDGTRAATSTAGHVVLRLEGPPGTLRLSSGAPDSLRVFARLDEGACAMRRVTPPAEDGATMVASATLEGDARVFELAFTPPCGGGLRVTLR